MGRKATSTLKALTVNVAALAVLWGSWGVSAESSKPFFDKPILLGAHRGGAGWRPESTLETFKEGARRWPTMLLETDVHMTKDGVVVCLHDGTVDRTTNGSGRVADLTWDDIKILDAGYRFTPDEGLSYPYRGKGITVPRLDEVLRALPGSRFLIELKNQPGIADATVKVIKEAGAVDRILLASFNPALMNRVQELAPRLGRCFNRATIIDLLSHLHGDSWAEYQPPDDLITFSFRQLPAFGVTPADIAKIRAKGIPVQVYSINDRKELDEALELGVDSFLTDYPDRMAGVLKELGRSF